MNAKLGYFYLFVLYNDTWSLMSSHKGLYGLLLDLDNAHGDVLVAEFRELTLDRSTGAAGFITTYRWEHGQPKPTLDDLASRLDHS
jgi:hypothetical protein